MLSTQPEDLAVEIEEVGDAASYSSSNGPSTRSYSASVAWEPMRETIAAMSGPPPSPACDRTNTSDPGCTTDNISYENETLRVDVSSLVQDIVNRSDYCGGNAMSFRIQGVGRRVVKSYEANFDNGGHPPRLVLNFDDMAGTCIKRTLSFPLRTSPTEDTYKNLNSSAYYGDDFFRGLGIFARVLSMRFSGIPLQPGEMVEEARIRFTTTLLNPISPGVQSEHRIQMINHASTPPFLERGYSRIHGLLTGVVNWNSVPPLPGDPGALPGQNLLTPDLKDMVNRVLSGANWVAGGNMVFELLCLVNCRNELTPRTVPRDFGTYRFTYEAPDPVPVLLLTTDARNLAVRYDQLPVREYLRNIVGNLSNQLTENTPSQETLYEAALYWMGRPVHFGRVRGAKFVDPGNNTPNTVSSGANILRLSHPGSYSGGTVRSFDGSNNVKYGSFRLHRFQRNKLQYRRNYRFAGLY